MTVMEACERSDGGQGSDPFWSRAAKQLLRNAVDLCRLSSGEVSLADIKEIIDTAPRSDSEIVNSETGKQSRSFLKSVVGSRLKAISRKVVKEELSAIDINDYAQTMAYWCNNFPNLADKTRSGIIATFTGMADMFLRGELSRLFCGETTITPEHSFDDHNKIIIVNLPIKQWGQVGMAAQLIIKLLWQQACERRTVYADTLPSFLWADEAHFFVSDYDQEFLTTARSSRACMVYLSQNMPNYLAALGANSKPKIDSLLGNFQTKIFHQNSDSITNNWAADLIGKDIQIRRNFGSSSNSGSNYSMGENSSSGSNSGTSSNTGGSEQIDYTVMPVEFSRLRKGGAVNDCMVDSIIHQGGRIWKTTGTNFLFTSFNQNI